MARTRRKLDWRSFARRLHRAVALMVGGWLALLGLTGIVLVWHGELDRALNPQWFAPRVACADVEQPVARALAIMARDGGGAMVAQVMAPALPGAAYVAWSTGADGARMQHFIDVSCDAYLGGREWGVASLQATQLVPALYELHRSLLSGEIGHVAVGFAGLAMLLVAISGTMTAWPRHASREAWRQALVIKHDAAPRRRYYDLHRAGGLWLVVFLLLMAVTGVYLCFPGQTRSLLATVLPMAPATSLPAVLSPDCDAVGRAGGIDLESRSAGVISSGAPDRLLGCAEALWPDATWSRISVPAQPGGAFEVRLLQRGEPRMDTGDTRVRLSADGRVLEVHDPLDAPVGNRVIAWLFPLHSGEAFGLVGRLLWTLLGVLPALMFATGGWLWWQRRLARRRAQTR